MTESLRDDLRRHVDNIITKLATVTLVLLTVTAYVYRNTKYNSWRDFLLRICLSTGLIVLAECSAHLRHRKRLLAGRAAS